MQIIGFNLIKVFSERKEKQTGKFEIKQNINIDNLSEDKIPFSEEVIKMDFTFNVDYEDFAKIEIKGNLILLPDQEESKEMLKEWKKKQIPEKFKIPLFNFIMSKCNVKAMQLEDELALPLHIPMPRLSPKKQE